MTDTPMKSLNEDLKPSDPWFDGYKTGLKEGIIQTEEILEGTIKSLRNKIKRLEDHIAWLVTFIQPDEK